VPQPCIEPHTITNRLSWEAPGQTPRRQGLRLRRETPRLPFPGITVCFARRSNNSCERFGRNRWVVERNTAQRLGCRHLRLRDERRANLCGRGP
jgi:hypothetical protein